LQHGHPAPADLVAQRRRQRPARGQRLGERGDVGLDLLRLVQEYLQEVGRAGVGVGPVMGDRPDLQLALPDAGGDHRAAQRMGRRLEHGAGRREMVAEGVVDDVPGPEPGGEQGAGEPPPVAAMALRVGDRPGRQEQPRELAHWRGGKPAERRRRGLQRRQPRLAQHRQPGERRARGQLGRVDLAEQPGPARRRLLGPRHLARQRRHQRRLACLRVAGFQLVVVVGHITLRE
jgi:hypothetical protein